MEATQEKTLHHTTETIEIVQAATPFADLDDEVKLAIECANEKKAFDITAIDLREIASFTEFFIICSGSNQRQVQAISDEITEKLREKLNSRVIRVEGYTAGEWVLLDYGDFIVHIFEQKARQFYDLERLWRDAKKVEIPKEV
ncbi:MAG: ribosome silencing factor [Acidobacteriota bacterium]|nr:ribosome silencing factor [Acidobacteriota bacterium]